MPNLIMLEDGEANEAKSIAHPRSSVGADMPRTRKRPYPKSIPRIRANPADFEGVVRLLSRRFGPHYRVKTSVFRECAAPHVVGREGFRPVRTGA
jgi:hypothetical protein